MLRRRNSPNGRPPLPGRLNENEDLPRSASAVTKADAKVAKIEKRRRGP
jgi:hypothetical protein